MIAAFVVVKRDIVDGLNGHRYLNELLVRRLDHADRSLYAKRLLQSTATLNVERLSYNKIFSSPNGFKIFKAPIPWAFAFGLDSREFSTPHEFEGATVKVDCVAFCRLDISEDVDEIVGKLEHPLEFLLF